MTQKWTYRLALIAALLAVANTPIGLMPQVQLAAAKPVSPATAPDNFSVTRPPAALPDPGFQAADGRMVYLADFRGKPLLVNFWATWCAPCVHELPGLLKLKQTMPDLRVVLINLDRGGPEAVAKFQSEKGLAGLVSHYDARSKFSRSLGMTGLPVTLLIDAEGRERGRFNGPATWDSPAILAFLRKTLSGQ